MVWNWEKSDWPNFTYNSNKLSNYEDEFIKNSGLILGVFKHLQREEQSKLTVELISEEAFRSSAIEGELLNRLSIQSSLKKHFGLGKTEKKIPPKEQGIVELMLDVHKTYKEPLDQEMLFRWNKSVLRGRRDIRVVGSYRTHKEPMQVISASFHEPKVHFEAPPSSTMNKEMNRFISWFNDTAPDASHKLPILTRAGIAHLYFVCIHPFEDGNGRIARALSEKVLAQGLKYPTLTSLSTIIEKKRNDYYKTLEDANTSNFIEDWLVYFSKTILEAQNYTLKKIEFILNKSKFYQRFSEQLNERQLKVIERMFREGPEGFAGGLSAENYLSITKTTRATATRDLQGLVECGALKRTGEKRYTRYFLNI